MGSAFGCSAWEYIKMGELTTGTQSTGIEPSRLGILPSAFEVAMIVGNHSCGFHCPLELFGPAIWPTRYTVVGT